MLGQDVELTATEFRLIEDLLRNAGRVRTREELLAAVWGYQFEGYARTVDTHIRRLRNKLGDAAEINGGGCAYGHAAPKMGKRRSCH